MFNTQKKCFLSTSEQFQSMSVTETFDIAEECKIPQLVEDPELYVIKRKMLMSTLPNMLIEFKFEWPKVSALF